MRAFELFKKLTLYYGVLGLIGLLFVSFFPGLKEYLPIGGAQSLLLGSSDNPFEAIEVGRQGASTFSGSMIWMFIASCSALLISLPAAWTYIASRKRDEAAF